MIETSNQDHHAAIKDIIGDLFDVFDEEGVIEVSVNPTLDVFIERFAKETEYWGKIEPHVVDLFVRYCATHSDTPITKTQPILSARVPGFTHRIEALIPPVVASPTFSMRRHLDKIVSIDEYVQNPLATQIIAKAIEEKKNILIAGSVSAGKTTLANACIRHLSDFAPQTRLLIIEDTAELQSKLANTIQLYTSDHVSMDQLQASSLRLAPDRILVGEVRTGAVLTTLLKAWNTGHPGGITTIHANSASEVLTRLQQLCSEVSVTDQTPFIMGTMDLVVFVTRNQGAPFVAEIARPIRSEHTSYTSPKMEILYAHDT